MREKNTPDWHFQRPELADFYLKSFALKLSNSRALFARRRMGKTEFLLQDLSPLASKQGYRVIYINLWECRDNTSEGVASAVLHSLQNSDGFLDRIKNISSKKIGSMKLSAKNPLAEGSLETRFESDPATLGLISKMWQKIDQTDDTILLLIDEAQILASANNKDLAAALRAGLDVRKQRIHVIFTGSSEHTLRDMFAKSNQPFYNWAPVEPFPLLDNLFVQHMIGVSNHILDSNYHLSLEEGTAAFYQLKQTPELFRRFLEEYLIRPFYGCNAAIERALAKTYTDQGFDSLWNELLPVDQIILQYIAARQTGLSSKSTRQKLGQYLGLGELANHTVNNALARLFEKQHLSREDRGIYRFEDDHFEEWIQLEHPFV
jgi:AAA+ ATPase superfamily predicted ATPase